MHLPQKYQNWVEAKQSCRNKPCQLGVYCPTHGLKPKNVAEIAVVSRAKSLQGSEVQKALHIFEPKQCCAAARGVEL